MNISNLCKKCLFIFCVFITPLFLYTSCVGSLTRKYHPLREFCNKDSCLRIKNERKISTSYYDFNYTFFISLDAEIENKTEETKEYNLKCSWQTSKLDGNLIKTKVSVGPNKTITTHITKEVTFPIAPATFSITCWI